MKLKGFVESGGEAKSRIQDGEIEVNGEVEKRRGRKLREGDVVSIENESYKIDFVSDVDQIESGEWA